MAGLHFGGVGGSGGKKPVDADIPLVPFIDLLLCCIMFLLVTAVWNQLASLEASQSTGAIDDPRVSPSDPELVLGIDERGYELGTPAGDRVLIAARAGEDDLVALREHLRQRRELAPNERRVTIVPEDGVAYGRITTAMDTLAGEGFAELQVTADRPY